MGLELDNWTLCTVVRLGAALEPNRQKMNISLLSFVSVNVGEMCQDSEKSFDGAGRQCSVHCV